MNLSFDRVLADENDKIAEVYEIIRSCGEDMFLNQGLTHWRTPYPVEAIINDCNERRVFIARDIDLNKYVHTFQLKLIPSDTLCESLDQMHYDRIVPGSALISKFATIPLATGKGIGKQSMNFIEDFCYQNGVFRLCLDVYEKNKNAIQFYMNRGFAIIGTKPTKYFTVYIMEKLL